ncbi:hypothetical protein ABE493_01045 [Stenotrophomonas terrae]|uniref:hypothetical protein n=1 Tax=Stenotrophomonas terrae TaxID=405446 RepID=UPI003208093C
MGDFWETFGCAGVAGFVCGIVIGLACAYFIADGTTKEWNQKVDIENACIAGNSNACRIYEVRYGR